MYDMWTTNVKNAHKCEKWS